MKKTLRFKLAGGVAALVATLGAGGAIAATQLSPTEESDAIVADAAKELGVDADELDAALKQALENRIDAAVEAGTLTEAQAAELKERIVSGDVPLVGLGPGLGHHRIGQHIVDLDAAASYLSVTEDDLRTSLEDGDTLADVAQAEGKTVDGLVAALVAAAKADLDEKVEEGLLTEAQRTQILATLESRITDVVNNQVGFGLRGGPGEPGLRHSFIDLGAAAAYLELTESELRTALEDGRTLADVAEAEGKSVDGLVAALVSAARERLDEAVEDGRLK